MYAGGDRLLGNIQDRAKIDDVITQGFPAKHLTEIDNCDANVSESIDALLFVIEAMHYHKVWVDRENSLDTANAANGGSVVEPMAVKAVFPPFHAHNHSAGVDQFRYDVSGN